MLKFIVVVTCFSFISSAITAELAPFAESGRKLDTPNDCQMRTETNFLGNTTILSQISTNDILYMRFYYKWDRFDSLTISATKIVHTKVSYCGVAWTDTKRNQTRSKTPVIINEGWNLFKIRFTDSLLMIDYLNSENIYNIFTTKLDYKIRFIRVDNSAINCFVPQPSWYFSDTTNITLDSGKIYNFTVTRKENQILTLDIENYTIPFFEISNFNIATTTMYNITSIKISLGLEHLVTIKSHSIRPTIKMTATNGYLNVSLTIGGSNHYKLENKEEHKEENREPTPEKLTVNDYFNISCNSNNKEDNAKSKMPNDLQVLYLLCIFSLTLLIALVLILTYKELQKNKGIC
ncbi:hypothetical protein CsNV_031 [Callinectes sapidus nudivirus]|nr:hypothetical protein CsNV_031 [Callinectes sapidus nudivirus]